MQLRALTLLCLFSLSFMFVACDDDDDETARSVSIQFQAVVGSQPLACDTVYSNLGATGANLELKDFRLYVSELALIASDGSEWPVALADDGIWQGSGVALLDFETGNGECSENGNSVTNTVILGTVADGNEYTGVRFTLGVPASENHQDANVAPAPLNVPAMWWVWRTGYKFARIDVVANDGTNIVPWNIHLGSTGCAGSVPAAPPESPCTKPNRPTYTLNGFNPDADVITFDLAALLSGVDVLSDTPNSPVGCMSNPADAAECDELFINLGIDFATGFAVSGGFDTQQFVSIN